MSDPRLVDMEPGGESTQYESIREFTITPARQTGQLGVGEPHTESELYTGIQPVQDGTASRDEYIMAQKLGMGVVDESGKETKHLLGRPEFNGHIERCIKADNNIQKIGISTPMAMQQPQKQGDSRGMGPAPVSGVSSTR